MDNTTPANYRTRPCVYFAKGRCNYGDNCTFLHTTVNGPSKVDTTSLAQHLSQDVASNDAANDTRSNDARAMSEGAQTIVSTDDEAEEASPATDRLPTSPISLPTRFIRLPPSPQDLARNYVPKQKIWEKPASFGVRLAGPASSGSPASIASFPDAQAHAMLAHMIGNPDAYALSTIKTAVEDLSPAKFRRLCSKGDNPLLYHAIQRKDPEVLVFLLKMKADPSQVVSLPIAAGTSVKLDPLVFALTNTEYKAWEDPNDIVKILLAYGSKTALIPEELLSYSSLSTRDLLAVRSAFPGYFLKHLEERLNAVSKYFLKKAARTEAISVREHQLLVRHDLQDLRRADYFEIGQEYATRKIHDAFLTRLFEEPKQATPLVLAFAGPSGHGKTNFAKAMGQFANCDVLSLDTSQYTHKFELFGGTPGYKSSEVGSPLNNHLAKFHEKRSVVLLDEFDKTDQDIRDSFLTMWDSGSHLDRRVNTKVDCSKTVFIVCTNAALDDVETFWKKEKDAIASRRLAHDTYDDWAESKVRRSLLQAWGAPIVSRISAVIPFLFFTPEEAGIGAAERFYAHRRYLGKNVHATLNMDAGEEWEVVQRIATRYIRECGYRSIENAAKAQVVRMFRRRFVPIPKPLPESEAGQEEYLYKTAADDLCSLSVRASL